jgi:hypothetical protein
MKEVAEGRDHAWVGRAVVVGAEERVQQRIGLEDAADARERVGVHHDVRVDEHEHLSRGPSGTAVSRLGGPAAALVGDDQLLGRLVG